LNGPYGGTLATISGKDSLEDDEAESRPLPVLTKPRSKAMARLTKRLAGDIGMRCNTRHAYTSMVNPPEWDEARPCEEDDVFLFNGSGEPLLKVEELQETRQRV